MTTFCGIFCLEGGDCSTDLYMMLAHPGRDPENVNGSWGSAGIGLAQQTVLNTPESFRESLPLSDTNNAVVIVGDIRLDNRSELCKKLGISQTASVICGDAFLVISAYKKWGASLTAYLCGDFAFAIWDSNQRKLTCYTDHIGSRGIFYFFNGKKFVFASTPDPILSLREVPAAINLSKLSTIVFPRTRHLFWAESWFNEIFSMLGATVMTVNCDGIRKQKYWEPDPNKQLKFRDEAEFEQAFKDVLFRSVGNRMRSDFPITALLSGGLDSSAVVSVAAKILESQNRQLEVFSAISSDGADPGLTDERYYIDQFKSFPNVNINYITAPGKGFFSDLEKFQTTIYSPNLIPSHYLYAEFANAAKGIDSRVILDGGGGEMGISFHGAGGYAELFKKMRWALLLHELKYQKQLTGESLWRNTYADIIRPLVPVKLLKKITGSAPYLSPKKQHCLQTTIEEKLWNEMSPRKKELEGLMRETSSSHRINIANQIRMAQNKAHGKADLGT
jgi:asparagine synthase (glutamine-hydrolysing)